MAAILTRLADPSLRSAPDWKLHSAKDATLGGLIQGTHPFIAGPETAEELQSSILNTLRQGKSSELIIRPKTAGFVKIIRNLFSFIQWDKSLLLYSGKIHYF